MVVVIGFEVPVYASSFIINEILDCLPEYSIDLIRGNLSTSEKLGSSSCNIG